MILSNLVITFSDWTYQPSLENMLLFLEELYHEQLLKSAQSSLDVLDRIARYKPYACSFETLLGHPVQTLKDLHGQESIFRERLLECYGEIELTEFQLNDRAAVKAISSHIKSKNTFSAIDFGTFGLNPDFAEIIQNIVNPEDDFSFYLFSNGRLWVQLGFSYWTIDYYPDDFLNRKHFRQLYPELNYPLPDENFPFGGSLISYIGNFNLSFPFVHTVNDDQLPEILAKLRQSQPFQTLQNLMRLILLQDRPDIEIQLRWATDCWPE